MLCMSCEDFTVILPVKGHRYTSCTRQDCAVIFNMFWKIGSIANFNRPLQPKVLFLIRSIYTSYLST